MTAPLALPTCRGPVGLPLTNSTCTRWPVPMPTVAVGVAGPSDLVHLVRQPRRVQGEVDEARWGRPIRWPPPRRPGLGGPASPLCSWGSCAWGGPASGAGLQAKSPWSGFWGRSTPTSSSGLRGSAPWRWASSRARLTSCAIFSLRLMGGIEWIYRMLWPLEPQLNIPEREAE